MDTPPASPPPPSPASTASPSNVIQCRECGGVQEFRSGEGGDSPTVVKADDHHFACHVESASREPTGIADDYSEDLQTVCAIDRSFGCYDSLAIDEAEWGKLDSWDRLREKLSDQRGWRSEGTGEAPNESVYAVGLSLLSWGESVIVKLSPGKMEVASISRSCFNGREGTLRKNRENCELVFEIVRGIQS